MPTPALDEVNASWDGGDVSSVSPALDEVEVSWASGPPRLLAYASGLFAFKAGTHQFVNDPTPAVVFRAAGRRLFSSGTHEALIADVSGRLRFRQMDTVKLFRSGVGTLAGFSASTHRAAGRRLTFFGTGSLIIRTTAGSANAVSFGVHTLAGVHAVASGGNRAVFPDHGLAQRFRAWPGGPRARFGTGVIWRNEP